ncbi:MAG: sulfite exporter TauE/SafE family protein [Treponema sp.]|jgi:sulfite exporter TauE/SafE/copper chaperone CopZ/plastocyanin domain-containing protein|nr:sulfite exporter TauE/SafE family protein [Treponema sp.]
MTTKTIHIGGMTCVNCQSRIERKLKSTVGVEDAVVNFNTGTAVVRWNASVLTFNEIRAVVEQLDYRVLDDTAGRARPGVPFSEAAGILVIIAALYMLLRGLGIGALTSAFPLAEAGMGYGMLFVVGLVTSLHCAAMCGGINLSQCIPAVSAASSADVPSANMPGAPSVNVSSRRDALLPAVLYNAGRVISYTIMGIIVGALGSVITVSGRFQGLVQLAAGVFMVIMGINMLGLFPWLRRFNLHLPKIFAAKINRQKTAGRRPLFIGLLNGLMPCGPLQAMQLYALSTGSPAAGGISMFLFSMGTVPLMFGLGALGSVLSAGGSALRRRITQAGAILVTVMGMTMFSYGFGLSGFSVDFAGRALAAINPFAAKTAAAGGGTFVPVIENGVQMISSTLSPGRYPAITVQAGIPVRWTISAPQGSINGCNNRMIIREYRIEHRFTPGENVIEFTPERTGRFSYSCWMGMIRSSITVVEEGQRTADIVEPGFAPSPAGVAIPTDNLALAEIQEGGYQAVTIKLRDDGIEPAIIVVQRDVPAAWFINNDSLDPGNSRLVFPAYYTQVDMEQGDNVIQLMPSEDFDFSTADNVFYGYVKVVDNLGVVDIEAVKAEVSEHETLIYPDAYFEQAAAGQVSCCVR